MKSTDLFWWTHSEEVGAAFGLLPDRRGGVGGLWDVDAELLLAGAGGGRHRRRVVTQAAAAVTRLRYRNKEKWRKEEDVHFNLSHQVGTSTRDTFKIFMTAGRRIKMER